MKWLRLLRAENWVKNLFVFVGLWFGGKWHDRGFVVDAVEAFLAFNFAASFVYIVNDLFDREADRRHPRKRLRPLASGAVSVTSALGVAGICAALAGVIGLLASPAVLGLVSAYVLLNLLYSWHLRTIVLLDVFCIATGFMIRIFAGTSAIGIPPSNWLILCGMMLALHLGFTKRRAELAGRGAESRKVLAEYRVELLDHLIGVTAACTIVCYGLYTMSPQTIAVHHTESLVYTTVFVAYGVFRSMYLLFSGKSGEDLAVELFTDRHLLFTMFAWGTVTTLILA